MADQPQLKEALKKFKTLYQKAINSDLPEPTAVTLATADPNGYPMARTVLLKEFDENGFVFYTNKESRKGTQLKLNPRAALCFFWQPLSQQVLIEGIVENVSDKDADEYWATRPRESRVGAWASLQSQILPNRETLISRMAEFEKKYANKDVPRPPHWSGYRIKPHRIEFWEKGDFRLHNRLVYQKVKDNWTKTLLYP